MPNNNLILRRLISPWRTEHMDVTRHTTLTHADLDNNFIYLRGQVIESATLDGDTLKLSRICGDDVVVNLSGLTQSNDESMRLISDASDDIMDDLNDNVTIINNTINELKEDVEKNSYWVVSSGQTNQVEPKNDENVTVHISNLNIGSDTVNDNSLTKILVSDEKGNVKYKDVSSFSDLNVVSGVYDIRTGVVTLTNNEGDSFEISGFSSGMTDSYTDEAYIKNNIIYFNNNIKGDDIYSVDISPVLDEVINAIGYNDRGTCSADSFKEYQSIADDYTNVKNEYDALNANAQQLETDISELKSQLSDAESQNPIDEKLIDELKNDIKKAEEDLARLKAQIKEMESTGDLDFAAYMPINEVNFNCWVDAQQELSINNQSILLNDIIYKEVENINKITNEIIYNIGYNDRGTCSSDSFTEYQNIAQNYTNLKNEYDALSANIQQLETDISELKTQLLNASTDEERNSLKDSIAKNEEDLARLKAQIKEMESNGDLDFAAYMPINEANFNCWVNANQNDSILNEINITNNNVTEQVEIINKTINEVVDSVGYNDRGNCSADSFTEYQTMGQNYTNLKNEYDALNAHAQQLKSDISELNSNLNEELAQSPVNEENVALIKENIDKNENDLAQTKDQIKNIESSGDLDFAAYMPINEANFNCWVNATQDATINDINDKIKLNGEEISNINNTFNSYTSTTQNTIEEINKAIDSGNGDSSGHIKDTNNPHQTSFDNLTSTAHTHTISDIINLQSNLDDINKAVASNDEDISQLGEETAQNSKIINEHINNTNNPHQTSFDNLTSTAHTHTISDVIGLQDGLDDINKSILSIDDVYVNQGSVDALNQKLIFTNTNGETFEVTNAAALFTDNDIHVVSGVYNPDTGIVTYTTNVGTTFEVSGFAKELTDSYTNSANLVGSTLNFNNNVKGDNFYSVDLSPLIKDLSGRVSNLENAEDADTFTQSASLSDTILTFTRNDNQTYSVNLSSLGGEDNDWSVNGNNMYSLPSGNVGIGTTTPTQKLDVNGVTKSDVFAVRNGVNTRIISPQGAEFENGGTVLNGRITVTAPPVISPTSQGTQFKATIKVIEDTTAFDVHVNCYIQKNTSQIIWHNAWIDSQSNGNSDYNYEVNLYFDVDGKFNIAIGSHDDAWRYCKVVVTDVILGLSKDTIDDWATGWSITLDSNPTIQTNGTLTRTISTTQANNWGRNTDNTIEYKSGNVKILGGNSLTINNYTLPSSDGTDGQVLKTDGNGNVSWSNDEKGNDVFTTSANLEGTNLTFTRNDNQTYNVDLSSLNSSDNDWGIKGGSMYSIPSGNIGIGTDSPQSKLHLEGSSFDNSAIRFLNTAGGFAGNSDYWTIGSRSFSSGADGFEIGRNFGADNGDSAGGKLYITNDGNVSIGNGTSPTNKLEVAGSALISNPNSVSDILTVESGYSNLTYGGSSGVGSSTNNLILKHNNKTVAGTTSSSLALKSANDESSISLTSYYTTNGTNISYNELVMNAGDSQVNIIAADNNAENSILSIQADESISFQSSIDAGASWPNDSKKTMTVDLTNDKVIIDGGFKLNNGTQGDGKVLVSDAEGNGTWGYYGLKVDYVNVKDISLGSSYNLSENTFTKVLTWETQENNTPDFILPVISSESKGNEVVVKHVGGKQSIIIVAPGVTKIDKHYSSVNITNGDSITFYCDGLNWYIKSHYKNIFGDIPGFFYTNDPVLDDTRIYFGSPSLSTIVTTVNIAASAQKVWVHTTDDFRSATQKADDGVAGSNWFVDRVTGNVAANITSGIDGEEITVYQTGPGDGGTIGFATSDGRASTLTVTTTK